MRLDKQVPVTRLQETPGFVCLFVFGCAESLLLGGPFSSCSRWGPLLISLHRILIAMASSIAEHRRQGTELQ